MQICCERSSFNLATDDANMVTIMASLHITVISSI